MKGLQYPANAHGLCHNVFKRLSLPQENTQKLNALGNSMDLILPFSYKILEMTECSLMIYTVPKGNRDNTVIL